MKGAIDPPQSPFIQRVSWQPTCVGLKQFYSKHLNVAKGKVCESMFHCAMFWFLRGPAIRFIFRPKQTEIKEILEGSELK